jgi:hypothetical protein
MESEGLRLYLVHCGFYDSDLCDGIYEGHANLFVAAKDFDDAKVRARLDPSFQKRRMHVDGVVEIETVQGCHVHLIPRDGQEGQTRLRSSRHRDLAKAK